MTKEVENLADNLTTCSQNDKWSAWFEEAELTMDAVWAEAIWPNIQGKDFTTTVEIAPGAGRNSERLKDIAKTLYMVDLNEYALEKCRARFKDYDGPCDIHIIKTDGTSLPGVPDKSATFVYSWDSMVHFDRAVIGEYLKECARVMKSGATGFIHHSNYGSLNPNAGAIEQAPHLRSNQSRENFAKQAQDAGLEVVHQNVFDWGAEKDLDCVTLFRKA